MPAPPLGPSPEGKSGAGDEMSAAEAVGMNT